MDSLPPLRTSLLLLGLALSNLLLIVLAALLADYAQFVALLFNYCLFPLALCYPRLNKLTRIAGYGYLYLLLKNILALILEIEEGRVQAAFWLRLAGCATSIALLLLLYFFDSDTFVRMRQAQKSVHGKSQKLTEPSLILGEQGETKGLDLGIFTNESKGRTRQGSMGQTKRTFRSRSINQ